MMQGLASFARGGDPNNAQLRVTWPAWPGKPGGVKPATGEPLWLSSYTPAAGLAA
jgi:hypothetical protein